MAFTRRSSRLLVAASLVLAASLALGLYAALRHAPPVGSGCSAAGGGQVVSLDTGQAGIAATIAGVAARDALPKRAVTVAYAAALQESKLQNLSYGDRDSVGVFQQRPSEGWGTKSQLEDPVYATSRFFSVLASIPEYQQMPVFQAAQDVQRSADGHAYAQYQPTAQHLASAFTGQKPHAVWCWYQPAIGGAARADAVGAQLARTFGERTAQVTGGPQVGVRVSGDDQGWAVAAWLVSHARQYRITALSYGGYSWSAASGDQGWARAVSGTAPGTVLLG